jgi:hypothetical protein
MIGFFIDDSELYLFFSTDFMGDPKKPNLKPQVFIALVTILPTIALAIWLVVADKWPVHSLIRMQEHWFHGEYYPALTFMVTWMMILLPIAIARLSIRGLNNKMRYGGNKEEGADGSTTITVYRPRQLFNMLNAVNIYVDGKKIGAVAGAGKKVFSVNPGNKSLFAKLGHFQSDPLEVSIRPGEQIVIEVGFSIHVTSTDLNPPANSLYMRCV